MNRKVYYTALFVVVIVGLFSGLYFLPNDKELALMYYTDKQFSEAYRRFISLYRQGDRSVPVVNPLVRTHLQMAQEDEAVEVMEEFVDTHDGDIKAHEYLINLYEETNRPHDHLRSLKEMYQKRPDEKILRQAVELQVRFEDEEGQAATLETLITDHEGKEEDFVTLARYYAAHNQDQKGVDILMEMLAQIPLTELTDSSLLFMIHLFAEAGYVEISEEIAKTYTQLLPIPDMAVDFAYALLELGHSDVGLEVIRLLPPDKQKMPIVTYAEINLLISNGLKDQTLYAMLKKRYDNGFLPDMFLDDLITLAATYENDIVWLGGVVNSIELEALRESTLLALFERSVRKRDHVLAGKLFNNLSQQYLDRHPVLEIALVLIDTDYTPTEKNFMLNQYMKLSFSKRERARIARYYFHSGFKSVAKNTLSDITSLEGLQPDETVSLALLYTELNLVDEGFNLMDLFIEQQGQLAHGYEKAWLILATAKGLDEEVLEKIDSPQNASDVELLAELTGIALSKKHGKLSVQVAERLWKLKKNLESQALLAEALVVADRPAEALPLYRHLVKKKPRYLDGYINALSKTAKQNPDVLDELKSVLVKVLQHEDLTEEQRRNIGYILVDNKMHGPAIETFWSLAAKSASFGNPDVEMLLTLWGEKPGTTELAWIEEQTASAEGDEKAKWMEHLLYVGAASSVVGIVQQDELKNDGIADQYLGALVELKEKEKMADVIAFILPDETRPERLTRLGKLAQGEGLSSTAELVWQTLLVHAPHDKNAKLQLGIINFSKGKYSQAQVYLYQTIQQGTTDYLAYYYYGELMLVNNCKKAAKRYFHQTAQMIGCKQEQKIEDKLILANCYGNMKCDRLAKKTYYELYQKHPNSIGVRIEYAAYLMKHEKYNDAACLLMRETFPDMSKVDPKERLDVELVRIQWLKQTGQLKKASCCMQKLVAENPCDPKIHAAAADIAFTVGNWRRASTAIRTAESLDPCNEGYPKIEKEINEDYRPWIGYAHEWKQTGDPQMEVFDRYHIGKMVGKYTQFIAEVESDYIRITEFFFANGGIVAPFNGQKWRGEAAVEHATCSGWQNRASVFVGDQSFGGGVKSARVDPWGKWLFTAEFHKPYWEFIELLIQDGTRDSYGVMREQRLTKRFRGLAGIAYHVFNLPDITAAATTIKFDFGLTKEVTKSNPIIRLLGEDAFMSFNYLIDAEYHLTRKSLEGPLGVEFYPVPAANRESHSWYFFLSKRFKNVMSFEGYGGFTYDRAVGGVLAPVGGLSAIIGNKSSAQAKIEVSHTTSTEVSSQDVDRLLIDVRVAY